MAKKKTYKALVGTEERDLNGNRFTKEALEDLAKQSKNLPVTINFDHNKLIGRVIEASMTEHGVEVRMSLDDAKMQKMLTDLIAEGKLYAVSSEIIEESHMEGDTLVIDRSKPMSFGFTTIPADTTLTPIKKVDDTEE